MKNKSWKYKILLFFVKLLSLLPLWFFYLISDFLYLIGYRIIGYRKKVVTANLKASFPEKTKQEIIHIRNRFYLNFCDWIVESIKGHTMQGKKFQKRIKVVEGMDIINDMIARKKSVISMNAHLFNWEWLCFVTSLYPSEAESYAIYQPAKRLEFTDLQNRLRNRFGSTKPIAMHETLRVIAKNHQKGVLAVYLFFADQAPPADNPFWTTFLNQETSFYLGGEKIASKFDYGVVYLDIYKPRRGYYEVSFKLISDHTKESKEYEITRAYTKILEKHIKKHPENWLWSHRRWKRKRPDNIPLIP